MMIMIDFNIVVLYIIDWTATVNNTLVARKIDYKSDSDPRK